MLIYPHINPIAFFIGPIPVHWYGLMYLFAFISAWILLTLRIKKSAFPRGFTSEELSDIIFYAACGVIIGGRLGYMFFYDFEGLKSNPLSLFEIWQGGMSFHGGMLGVMASLWILSRLLKKSFIDMTDFIAPVVPIGLAFGRLGNFINGELWGRATSVPWAMVFPNHDHTLRHPSQLYEFLLEGCLLFLILWIYSRKPRPRYAVSGLFLVGYGLMRFLVEFFREPDIQLGFVAGGWMTQGQLLCLPMIIVGIVFLIWAARGSALCNNT